ncbi:MAG: hypothetical protein O3A97_00570 [Proteobacteria bacterium]|nr:hypothetical protein [Pseudomonadota bacterium]
MDSTTGLLGYCQPLATTPGAPVDLKISSNGPENCSVEILRVICADIDPNGPGQQFEPQGWGRAEALPVRVQPVVAGSYGLARKSPDLPEGAELGFGCLIHPTLPGNGKAQTLCHWGPLWVGLDGAGRLMASLGDAVVLLPKPVLRRCWYRLKLTAGANQLTLQADLLAPVAGHPASQSAEAPLALSQRPGQDDRLLLGAALGGLHEGRLLARDSYNGKIEAPEFHLGQAPSPLAAWDFAQDQCGTLVKDMHGACDLELFNTPMRGATGHLWDGSSESWIQTPEQYAAIHFHDDDMTDCQWQTNLTLSPPADARTGFYVARLRAPGIASDVPFFISARPGAPRSRLLVLAPTATYLSYANTHIKFDSHNTENLYEAPMALSEDELYLNIHRELGLSHYDTHADDSGVVYASERRPMLNMRPGLYTFNYINDTHVLKWLEMQGQPYDLATDPDLHRHGRSLLDGYDVVMTLSHPEYWSTPMWDALDGWQEAGGRHMYLGGNGFYWRIAWSDAHPCVIENRRGISGVRTWEGEPGEHHLSFTGEPGGLWRSHGRAPQRLVGNGFSSTLFVRSTWFRRTKAGHHPRHGFIFRGVNDDVIGDFGYRGGGAVGLEIDRWDPDLGSPRNSVVLATSEAETAGTLLSGEEYITTTRALDGKQNARARCDMVYFTTAGGGAVWSTGSIAWATSLMWNGGRNSVSQITANVLERFLDPAPLDTG